MNANTISAAPINPLVQRACDIATGKIAADPDATGLKTPVMTNPTCTVLADLECAEQALAEGSAAALSVARGVCALAGVRVVRAYADRVGRLDAACAKVAKLAARLGCEAPRYSVLGEIGAFLWIAIYGQAPRLEGYTFLARIEHTTAGNLVSAVGEGQDLDLTAYRTAPPTCAHCETTRRRRDTFVLRRDADGAHVQIGRNCLADFIRSADVGAALKVWDLLHDMCADDSEDPEVGGWGGCGRGEIGTAAFLTFAVASVRTSGFHKSGEQGSTKGDVSFLMSPRPSRDPQAWDAGQPTPADVARAVAVRAWILAGGHGAGDYMYNLTIAATLPGVGRNAGLLASAPSAYAKHVEGVVAKAREAARPVTTTHVGAVGVRSELGDLTVVRVRSIDGDYGTRTIVAAEDAAGNAITWFASGAKDFDAGDVLQAARGTVKKHDAFRGQPQTVVSRLAWAAVVKHEALT